MTESQKNVSDIFDIINTLKYKKIPDEESRIVLCQNLYALLEMHYDINLNNKNRMETQLECGRLTILHFIPLLEKYLTRCKVEYMYEYNNIYLRAYALAGRTSLEHFITYMEWDREVKVLPNRLNVLRPVLFYLNKSMFDENLKKIVISLPPSYGKSFAANYYTAWAFGRHKDGSILRLSYSDALVQSFSRSVQDLLISSRFSDVFTSFKQFNGRCFDVEKVSDWKIKNSDTLTSLYSRTRDGSTTGVRAKTSIIFDDMTKGAEEANSEALHSALYDKWTTEWFNRKNDNNTKFIFIGTMWSPSDLLNRIREDTEKYHNIIPSKKFKYVWEAEDGSAVFIRIPLLDENNKSTCEVVTSTKDAIILKETTDPFLFSCVYQQDPIAPTGREFAYENLNTYERLPKEIDGEKITDYSFAVLDPARKGKDYVSMPIFKRLGSNYYLVDVLFQRKAMTELYDDIVSKVIEHKVTTFVIENNIDVSLKTLIEDRLRNKSYVNCIITEKYNTVVKEKRIKDQRGLIKQSMVFKDKNLVKPNTDYGDFMKYLTTYSFDYANKHDDAPDSLALFVSEIILGKYSVGKAKPIKRIF